MKKNAPSTAQDTPLECCEITGMCPLSAVNAGTVVCIRRHLAQPSVIDRLRELGLGEHQQIRLVSQHPSLICQVCNTRIALSPALAAAILVEPV